jgi:hypothetical protein
VDGAVEIGGEIREQRFLGYSVGRWVDDYHGAATFDTGKEVVLEGETRGNIRWG